MVTASRPPGAAACARLGAMSPARSRRTAAAALSLLLLAGACGGDGAGGPNVLLVTLDTTRADRIGCYGYEAARTPALDALAAEGVLFERARANVPLTLPSHATILTGVHPGGHGLHVNFQGALSSEVRTLAEDLRARGWRTAAFVGAWVLNAEFGLSRGFELYDDLKDRTLRRAQQAELPADEVCDAALEWLGQDSERPFFAWVHFFDAHDPYEPPARFARVGQGPYDGEIAFADSQLARLVRWLEVTGRRADTIVVVAGDHGESLGEHGEAHHGLFVTESAVRVPLVLSWPGQVEAGTVAADPVGLVDLAPTLLDLLGMERAPTSEGRSLVAALRGGRLPSAPKVLESEYALHAFGWAPVRALVSRGWKYVEAPTPELYDLRNDPDELDNLADSESERAARMRAALATYYGGAVQRDAGEAPLDEVDAGQLGKLGYVGGVAPEVDFEEAALLRDPKTALHIQRGAMRAARLLEQGRNEEVVALLEPLLAESPESDEIWSVLAQARLELGQYPAASEAFEKSLRARPDDALRLISLGDALRLQGRSDEARARYERALEIEPDNGKGHSRLGLVLAQAGRMQDALEHFRRHAELDPTSASAHCNVANALLAQGMVAEGIAALRRALAHDPGCAQAHGALWRALKLAGERRAAIAALRAARDALPDEDGALEVELAWELATWSEASREEGAESLALALAGLERRPRDPRAADALGAAQASLGDFEAAVASAQRALRSAQGLLPAAQVQSIRERIELYRSRRPYRE